MSRHNSKQRDGVTLPFALRKELGLPDVKAKSDRGDRRGRGGSRIADRKQQRQASRVERRGKSVWQNDRNGYRRQGIADDDDDDFDLDEDEPEDQQPELVAQAKPQRAPKQTTQTQVVPPKSISKQAKPKTKHTVPEESDSGSDSGQVRASSPGITLNASSKAFQDRAAQDDAEIMALEKKLGMKKKKSTSMGDDMLDYLLEGLEEEEDGGKKRKREGQDWLAGKRRKIADIDGDDGKDSDEENDIDGFEDEDLTDEDEEEEVDVDSEAEQVVHELDSDDEESDDDDVLESSDEDGTEDFSGFDSEDQVDNPSAPKVRENPYIAPVTPGTTTKYIPPSLRKRDEGGEESLARIKRQVQGHLNKLSEANMISILGEIEKLYRTNPRQDVTTALIELLLATFSNPSSLQNTFIILHAAFIAAVYKVMGIDFGAELLCKLVENFDEKYKIASTSKEALNLISLLANLFTFGVVSSNIIYDHIKLLLSEFSESNAELLLRVVRDCGPQLRSDDPTALKGIVQMMHDISADLTKKGQQLNIRTRVMMDTITDLKNNKMKNATNAAGMTGEHITRMRKALGSLNTRSLKATEPLRITRADIENSDKRGKWWLIGASWKGNDPQTTNGSSTTNKDQTRHTNIEAADSGLEDEVDFLSLARQYRMNTDVRRSIFVAIMSATDCRDAQTRMLKLRLTNKQEHEITKVLLRCARAEPAYNPYYALLARNLCKENRRVRVGFQFGLWDFFSRMGEKPENDEEQEEDDDDDETVELHEIVNVAKMYAYLIFHNHLTLSVLKVLNMGFLKEQAMMFLEILLISVMTQPKATEEELLKVFGRTGETPHIVKSLQYFVKKNVRRSDLMASKDKARVKEGCQIADVAFGMIQSAEFNLAT